MPMSSVTNGLRFTTNAACGLTPLNHFHETPANRNPSPREAHSAVAMCSFMSRVTIRKL